MAILVTGGTGYIGSVTVERLRAKGEQVVVLDDLARGHRAALPADIPFYQGKIGDRELVARIAREHKLESCIHFAALIEVGESVIDPAKYFENNVGHGIALMGAARSGGRAAYRVFLHRRRLRRSRANSDRRSRAANGQKIPTAGPSYSWSGSSNPMTPPTE